MDLFLHYRNALKLDLHVVKYEDVISNFEPTIKNLLSFLKLDWEDGVLAYNKTAKERDINTPSYADVTKKLFASSIGRWQKYDADIQSIYPTLKPFIEQFGYKF